MIEYLLHFPNKYFVSVAALFLFITLFLHLKRYSKEASKAKTIIASSVYLVLLVFTFAFLGTENYKNIQTIKKGEQKFTGTLIEREKFETYGNMKTRGEYLLFENSNGEQLLVDLSGLTSNHRFKDVTEINSEYQIIFYERDMVKSIEKKDSK